MIIINKRTNTTIKIYIGCFFNSSAQPTRIFCTSGISGNRISDWLPLVFHFGTENWEEQLKKPPCINADLVFEGDATVVCSLRCDFPEDRSGWKVTSSTKESRFHLSPIKNELFLKGKSHRLVIFATVSEYDHLVLEMSKMTSISIWSPAERTPSDPSECPCSPEQQKCFH